jgi:hypothetical protein
MLLAFYSGGRIMSYQKYPLFNGEEIPFIKRKSDNASIPFDEANTDYQKYLAWVAEGNTAEKADNKLTWDDIRSTRDQILRDTDWTMTSGATVDQAQWAAYRQVIRDIPQTYKDKTPDDVVWPTQPSTAGPNT